MDHRISIVIPVFRGESTIGPLVDRLFDELGESLIQVILVNDGSPDQSDRVCRELFLNYGHRVSYLRLARNYSEHNAVMAGLSRSTGDFTVIMDDDFQNPPEEVLKLVEYASSHDYDVVYSCYSKKMHSLWRNLGSRLNDRMATILLKKPQNLYLSSFKCLNRWLVKERLVYARGAQKLTGRLKWSNCCGRSTLMLKKSFWCVTILIHIHGAHFMKRSPLKKLVKLSSELNFITHQSMEVG